MTMGSFSTRRISSATSCVKCKAAGVIELLITTWMEVAENDSECIRINRSLAQGAHGSSECQAAWPVMIQGRRNGIQKVVSV